MNRRKLLSFFYTDEIERQILEPIAREAERRGHPVRRTSRVNEPTEIGFYCSHNPDPSNARLSIIMLHDLAQRHDIWPDFWKHEPWNRFDIGILPGPAWRKRWLACAGRPEAHPRLGIYELGWPKADAVFRDPKIFQRAVESLRTDLRLSRRPSVLYVPSWEHGAKQHDVVRSLQDLPVNLLLKQAPRPDVHGGMVENVQCMSDLYHGGMKNVHALDPLLDTIVCLGLADLLITDESSVMIEALLLGVPVVTMTDWVIPDCHPPRPASVPFDFPVRTTRAELRRTVEGLLGNLERARCDMARLRDEQFSCLGESAERILDMVEACWDKQPPPSIAVETHSADLAEPMEYRFDGTLRIWRRDDHAGLDYSDGKGTEERILRIINNATDLTAESPELQRQITDWPTEYHLSSARGNLIRWLELKKDSAVLELGCGCGAITRVLGEMGARVTAVEGALRRAAAAAARCRDLANVRVIADHIDRLCPGERYDVVTLIGVLEYAPLYTKAEDPVRTCLVKAGEFLKDDGMLILAIENQLGLKYFAGCSEDHVGRPFFGVADLYGPRTPVTFGRAELKKQLADAGFEHSEFLYPFPDYKLPRALVSDVANTFPAFRVADLLARIPSRDYGRRWTPLFSECLAAQALERNGLMSELANSFLVVATRAGHRGQKRKWIAVHYSMPNRRAELRVETTFVPTSNGIEVHRRRPHCASTTVDDPRWRHFLEPVGPYHEGTLYATELLRLIDRGATIQEIAGWARPWLWFLLEHATWPQTVGDKEDASAWLEAVLPGDFVDCVPFNLIRDRDGSLRYFDREWVCRENVPLYWVLLRGFWHLLHDLPPPSKQGGWEPMIRETLSAIGLPVQQVHEHLAREWERSLQQYVSNATEDSECVCSIIIPVWNKVDLTAQCLRAIARMTTDLPHEVIVVDNGSTDETGEFLKSSAGNIRVISNKENLGFAKACNQGARAARGKYLVFLNNDTVPLKGWLQPLVSEVEERPEVGIVGSKLLYPDGTVQHAGVAFMRENLGPYHIYQKVSADLPAVNRRREFQAVTAACLLIRRTVFETVGGFDEAFVNGFEDVDLCLKVRRIGFRVVYQPRSVLYHFESQTPGRKTHDAANSRLLRERWNNLLWLEDEDLHYHTDGYKLVGDLSGANRATRVVPLTDVRDRAAWAHVAAAQAAALKEDWEALRREIHLADDWPNDRFVLAWGVSVAKRLQEPAAHTRFLSRFVSLTDEPAERLALARLLLEQKNLPAAEEQVRMALASVPDHPEGLFLQGVLCMQREQYVEAERAFSTAFHRGADRAKCLIGMGMAAMGRSYPQGAWEKFCEVLADRPDDPEAIHWLLRAGTAQNRWEELSHYVRAYVERNPGDLATRFALAGVLLRADRIEEARKEQEAIRALDPAHDGLAELEQAISKKEAVLAVEATEG